MYHSKDRAVRPNLDCVFLKQLVSLIEDDLHTWEIFFIQYAKQLLIVAKYLEVCWRHKNLRCIINITYFGEIFKRPGFQMTISITLALVCLRCNLRGTLLKKMSGLR